MNDAIAEVDEDDDVGEVGGTLIRSFGELWSRDMVDWDKGEMLGERRKFKRMSKNATRKEKSCDVWHQRGVYALYHNFRLVYVGQAISTTGIGGRLHDHATKSRFNRQWDSFSWFSIDGFDDNGKPSIEDIGSVDSATLVRTLELVTILIADPPLNRSRGRFKGAERIVQDKKHVKTSSNEDVLQSIRDLLDRVKLT